LAQIADQQARRVKAREEQVEYKKPHFGPEETAEVIDDLENEHLMKK